MPNLRVKIVISFFMITLITFHPLLCGCLGFRCRFVTKLCNQSQLFAISGGNYNKIEDVVVSLGVARKVHFVADTPNLLPPSLFGTVRNPLVSMLMLAKLALAAPLHHRTISYSGQDNIDLLMILPRASQGL